MPTRQLSLSLISHTVNEIDIPQRAKDGYINATDMCKASGKLIADYLRLGSSKEFLDELQADMGIPISELIQSAKGGDPHLQGTWVHPDVAIHLAQWLSPKFAVMVSKWVREWMSGGQPARGSTMPYHLQRHVINQHKIPVGYFSVLQAMTIALVAPMEAHGYRMKDDMMPDVTHGKMLCKHLREQLDIDTNELPTYVHTFPDGREVNAKLYPVKYLGEFHVLLAEIWIPLKSTKYFQDRDPNALLALDKLLLISHVKPTAVPANKSRFKKIA
jgi:KilA-N domain